MGNENDDDDENDSDLEAELAKLSSGGGPKPRPKPKAKPQIAASDLDRMVAESLRDIGSDEELSGDDDDPDLLNELSAIVDDDVVMAETEPEPTPPISPKVSSPVVTNTDEIFVPTTTLSTAELIKSRIQMYREAEQNAKEANEGTRAKRFGRGLKTLESLLKQVNAGKTIDVNELPPEVAVKLAQTQPEPVTGPTSTPAVAPIEVPLPVATPIISPPSDVSPPPPVPVESPSAPASVVDEKVNALLARQKEYKEAALEAKRGGDKAAALQYVKIAKLFDQVLAAARAGEAVDLSDMPPPPSELNLADLAQPPVATASDPPTPAKEEQEIQKNIEPAVVPEQPIVTATTVLGALTQRLEVFQAALQKAKDEGNTSKARRQDRIVKQFETAIKQHKAGKPVDFEELPTPPGYGPIPVPGAGAAARPAPAVPQPRPSPASPPPATAPSPPEKTRPTRPPLVKQDSRASGNHSSTSLMQKNIDTLLQRQKEFKDAALAAKKSGEIEEAKEYLKIFKQFESLLSAARGGLPIDLSSVSEQNKTLL